MLATCALVGPLWACPQAETEPTAPPQADAPFVTTAQVDDKAKLYNLIGRWYPSQEVARLKDDTLTPEEWCKRPPVRVNVLADSIEVQCSLTEVHTAPLARVRTSTAGDVILSLRVSKESTLRQLRFEQVQGPRARLVGSPCPGFEAGPYERFPEYEIITRQILSGRRCTQFETLEVPPAP